MGLAKLLSPPLPIGSTGLALWEVVTILTLTDDITNPNPNPPHLAAGGGQAGVAGHVLEGDDGAHQQGCAARQDAPALQGQHGLCEWQLNLAAVGHGGVVDVSCKPASLLG